MSRRIITDCLCSVGFQNLVLELATMWQVRRVHNYIIILLWGITSCHVIICYRGVPCRPPHRVCRLQQLHAHTALRYTSQLFLLSRCETTRVLRTLISWEIVSRRLNSHLCLHSVPKYPTSIFSVIGEHSHTDQVTVATDSTGIDTSKPFLQHGCQTKTPLDPS